MHLKTSIDYIGINDTFPSNIKYFKEELFSTIITNPNENKKINKIVSASIDYKINSMKLLNTQVRTSNEGQKLTGKKLLVEMTFLYRIKYISDSKEKFLYILKEKNIKVVYIVLPKYIDELKIDDLVRRKKLKVEPYIQDLYVESRGVNKVYIRTLLLLNATIKS